jgi:hypothetical protein
MLRVCLIAICGLLLVPSALAKDFGPGDLRVCGRDRCVSITDRHVVRVLSRYYYSADRLVRAARVPRGTTGFELRWRNGYASGMVAGAMLKRFRAYGFYCERFERGQWYWFPRTAASGLRQLTAHLRPLRVVAPPHSC